MLVYVCEGGGVGGKGRLGGFVWLLMRILHHNCTTSLWVDRLKKRPSMEGKETQYGRKRDLKETRTS